MYLLSCLGDDNKNFQSCFDVGTLFAAERCFYNIGIGHQGSHLTGAASSIDTSSCLN